MGVSDAQARTRRALAACAVIASLAAGACGPSGEGARTVSLRMRGGPPEATVTIDEQIVGSLAMVTARGVALPPGVHRISVEAAGFLPWDQIVEAKDVSAPLRLDVSLVPVPD